MEYGRDVLGFDKVLAITSLDNDVSGRLLEKLGFRLDKIEEFDGEPLKIYSTGIFE